MSQVNLEQERAELQNKTRLGTATQQEKDRLAEINEETEDMLKRQQERQKKASQEEEKDNNDNDPGGKGGTARVGTTQVKAKVS